MLIVLAIIVGTMKPGTSDTPAAPLPLPPVPAAVACQSAIVAKLRSPSTANFPTLDQVWTSNDSAAMIIGVVDAQNGFGATVRDSLACLFRRRGKSSDWTLIRSAIAAR